MNCPVCDSDALSEFLSRERVPVHQNLRDQAAAMDIQRADLALVACHDCGFIFNRAFDPDRVEYNAGYGDTSRPRPSASVYLDELVRHMIEERGVRNCHIIEVGGGQGFFLRKLVECEGSGNTGQGFDPSYVGELNDLDGRLKFESRHYDRDCANVPADIVVTRHVIEHIPDPLTFLSNIRTTLASSENSKVFCETPCVEWILRNQVIWDFYYEHCSYFSASSLSHAFETAGFRVENARHVFQGQYLWLEAVLRDSAGAGTVKEPEPTVTLATNFASAEGDLIQEWSSAIKDISSRERIALWGAGAKGVTFANLIDPRRELIDCVVDLSPHKQGRFIPGTAHPVVSPVDLPGRGVTTAILMNPNYRNESLAILQEINVDIRLVEKIDLKQSELKMG